ncbi:MAG: Mov34/MPN/PAD-1 family protein, partial [Candidatus Helarchaeota archaeon]|nr:Mov34/MPN/PAD-1 family protein [Candidatus Helarchaeota archaeon]
MLQDKPDTPNSTEQSLVILKFQAYKDIVLHSTRFANPGINKERWREVYGFLIGTIENNNVIIHESIPMVHGGATEVEFEEQHYIEAAEINEKAAEKSLFLVGWYHSHPGLQIFLSSVDIKNHIGYQGLNPQAIALVIDPSKINATYSGFEIFRLDDATNLNSSYHKINWKITDLDEKFVGQMLIDLSHRATIQRPLVEEYGEAIPDTLDGMVETKKIESQSQFESQSQSPELNSVAVELLEKALSYGGSGEYEKAIDLAVSAGKKFEENGKE